MVKELITMDKKALLDERKSFVSRLALMKTEAGALGLYRTLHALDQTTNTAGWEIADLETGKQADTMTEYQTGYCEARDNTGYGCTREPGHSGPHVSDDGDEVCAVWDNNNKAEEPDLDRNDWGSDLS